MAYTRTTWVKNQTPLSAENLNNIESGLEAVDKIVQNLLDKTYPVGSIYISVNDTSPSELFGGTWEAVAQGRTLVGVGYNVANTTDYWGACGANTVNFPAGEMGGQMRHTLTIDEMPSHRHSFSTVVSCIGGGSSNKTGTTKAGNDQNTINGTAFNPVQLEGGGSAHNNLQPYLAVYMWKRTA